MDFSQFHFENALWLWGIVVIPAVLLLYALFYKGSGYAQTLERFADKHLLPHLLKSRRSETKSLSKPLLLWSLAWLCGMLAMAGPRWNYTEVQAFRPEKDLVIVLDLSTTMSAQDVKPSRVIQARERIEDLLNMSRGITVGLVAYAAVPHMIAPLTDDTQTLRNLLPAIDTSLVTLQGDRLKPALEMAARMLDAEPGNSKSILVISDGDFEEHDAAGLKKAAGGAAIYTMSVGTAEGAPIAEDNGGWVKDSDGRMLIAKVRTDKLQALGAYIGGSDSDSGIKSLVARINGALAGQQSAQKNIRIWQERFYIPALALALLLLPLFRKGYIFPVVFFLMFSTTHAEASWTDWFLNNDQQGAKAYNEGDYKAAMEKFDMPYQHGVAAYKAGQYDQAAQSFKAVPDARAEYNLGNSQLMQNKPEDAIATYEDLLKKNPDDAHVKHNLEIARKVLEQKKQQQQQNKNNPDQKKPDQKNNGEQDKQQSQKDQQQSGKDQSQQQQQANDKQQSGQKQDAQNQQNQSGNEKDKDKPQADKDKPQAGKDKPQAGQEQKDKTQSQPQSDAQAQQQKDQQQKEQQQKEQQQQTGKETTGQESQPKDDQQPQAVDTRPRTQQDINADQWLDRIQNDPGSFLKNQFMIEDRKSGEQ
jgi:Ca-activated chloride channel family protein